MKKSTLLLIVLFTIASACKNDSATPTESTKEKLLTSKKVNSTVKKAPKIKSLNKEQLSTFFPDYLGSHKQFDIFAYAQESLATASYGSFDNSYNYSLSDGIENTAIVKNFEATYQSKLIGPEGTQYIRQERNGYKTLAFLQPKINRYSIEFIYKNRFKLVLEGPEVPDILWSYIKKKT